jgi:multidrug efflux pump subunit AcrA (membrane-fusion protein)
MLRCGASALALIVLFVAGSVQAQQRPGQEGTRVSTAVISTMHRTLSVGGRLLPGRRIMHHAPSSGWVSSLVVEEGQAVRRGQPLFSVSRSDDPARVFKPVQVNARISGRVSDVLIEMDGLVSEGQEAIVIIDTEGYEMEAFVSDKDVFDVDTGTRVEGSTPGGAAVSGVLVHRSLEPDYDTGLFTLTFRFDGGGALYPGQFILVELAIGNEIGVFVQRDLVARRYGSYFLWVVDENMILEAREVTLGPAFDGMVKIERGLEPGERYLSRLTGREREGTAIEAPGS